MPVIMVFIFMGMVLVYEKVGDILNIPRSKFTYAKVVLKENRSKGMGMRSPLAYNWRITFEIGNFKLIELIVPLKTYDSVSVGSRGVLVHTDSRFRGFHVDKKIPDLVKPKKNKRKNKITKKGGRKFYV